MKFSCVYSAHINIKLRIFILFNLFWFSLFQITILFYVKIDKSIIIISGTKPNTILAQIYTTILANKMLN